MSGEYFTLKRRRRPGKNKRASPKFTKAPASKQNNTLSIGYKSDISTSESEESDGEGGLGNLNRVVVRPPGHSGKAKRGHLCFDAAFECGNLGRADHVNELEYDLFLRPDTCRPRSRFWFNFTVENVKQDQRVIFNFVNFGKDKNLFAGDMTPIVRSSSRPKWQRIPRRYVFYHRSTQHRGKHVMSVAFAFDKEEDIFHFAAGPPYSYSRLQKYLAAWEKKTGGFATRELLALSTQKRRVELLTISEIGAEKLTNGDDVETPTAKSRRGASRRRVVLIIARAHGGEAPASYVCQGFLDFLASSTEAARALRCGITLKILPMLNPDGVFLGSQRSDLLGGDLNRAWHRATTFAHPALVAANKLVEEICADKSLQLDFIVDIHANVSREGVFVHGNSYDDVYRFERHAVLPKFIGARVEAWKPDGCLFNSDNAKTGTARRSLVINRPTVDAYSLLVSLGGRRMTPRGPYIHYTEDAYGRVGRALAKSLCDYYRHVGVIPPRAGTDEKKREGRGRRARLLRVRRRRAEHEVAAKSSDSSPERRMRCLAPRNMSPPLPPTSPIPQRRARRPIRTARHTQHQKEPIIPLITGFSMHAPRLTVVDLSSCVRAPGTTGTHHAYAPAQARRARPPRPAPQPRYTSDDYTTPDSDSY